MEAVCRRLGVSGQEVEEEAAAEKSERAGKKRILVVDDNGTMLRTMKAMLSDRYEVAVAVSGAQAMTSIGKQRPDLILLDYEMPVCDGRMTLEMIRADEEMRDIPVMFLTAVNDRENIEAVLRLKPAGYFLKPPVKDISEYYESDHIPAKAIIAQDYSWDHSHWQADRSLSEWLREEKIPGIYGIDTRALTKHLRDHGSMLGKIIVEGCDDIPFYNPNLENLVAKVSCRGVEVHGEGPRTVVLVDCGVKHNIIRCLTRRGVRVVRVPWDYDFTSIPYDGLFISNGPGNPDMVDVTVDNIRKAMETGKPICGICMGNQLLARAAGASTYIPSIKVTV